MRMRRKKNLSKRTDSVGDIMFVLESTVCRLPEEERYQIKTVNELFSNNNPLEIEIGCGKGQFIVKHAKQRENVNFIGVEMIQNVLISACEKVVNENIKNVKFFNMNAQLLRYVLEKESVQRIYLNFSCPYPKNYNENRRLTYKDFLELYKTLLVKNGEIVMKTDSDSLYRYSLRSFKENGYEIVKNLENLYENLPSDNISTEYEDKFVSLNKPIHYIVAKVK